MTHDVIAPAQALAFIDPGLIDSLPPELQLVALFDNDLWLRPAQRFPDYPFRTCGWIAGRGNGKTKGITAETNRRVQYEGVTKIALQAPTKARVIKAQIEPLIESADPWFVPERTGETITWPNGVTAEVFTPEAPGRARGSNFEMAWMTELVDWQGSNIVEAWSNVATATRCGKYQQIFWDTTSEGKNALIQKRLTSNKRNPLRNPIFRGSLYDNPYLTRSYVEETVSDYVFGSRRYLEEIEGEVFLEAAGALWKQDWLDYYRVRELPAAPSRRVMGWDPATSTDKSADESGLSEGCLCPDGFVYIEADYSGQISLEEAANRILDGHQYRRVAGVIIERNRLGDAPRDMLRVIARQRGSVNVVMLDPKDPMPNYDSRTLYVREVVTHETKSARAEAPAALYSKGKVRHVGTHALLEAEYTSWSPGSRSPNRLDAAVYVVTELCDLWARDKTYVDSAGAAALHTTLRERIIQSATPTMISRRDPSPIGVRARPRVGL